MKEKFGDLKNQLIDYGINYAEMINKTGLSNQEKHELVASALRNLKDQLLIVESMEIPGTQDWRQI